MEEQKNELKHIIKKPPFPAVLFPALCAAAFITSGIGRVDAAEHEAYRLCVNGSEVGTVKSGQDFYDAFSNVRERITDEADEMVYLDLDYTLEPVPAGSGEMLKPEQLEEVLYENAENSVQNTQVKAYTIKINQYTVTLASKEEIIALLEAAKSRYDTCNDFMVELVTDTSKELPGYTVRLQKKDLFEELEGPDMSAGVEKIKDESQHQTNAALKNLEFAEEIEIVETYVQPESIISLDEAILDVTKEKEKDTIYEVVSGDCLSVIAEKTGTGIDRIIALNELSGTGALLQVGDELIVTVPEPELSVITETITTYEEDYTRTEYIDNNEWYTTKEVVISEGTTGHHQVTDIVTAKNGVETSREQIAEVIMTEAQPTVIERGTVTPPTYIKPISNGRFSSGFKFRWGRMHKGVDWSCPIGTAVKASSAGTVVQAGWSSGYGYCITLSHPDGKKTRYAHLKKILVSNGQTVKQGEKIALSGNTGRSTGPHLHFEIIVNGSQVDPLKYIE